MDVEAGHAVVGLDHLLKGLVGDGEQGVAAEHGLDHVVVLLLAPLGEIGVLLNGLGALVHAVPLGHLVTQVGPNAHFSAHILDGEQGAGDFAEGGVMVEDGGDAVPDAVQHRGVGAGPGAVQGQVAVDIPPLAVQHLEKVGGVKPVDGQTPGQAAVDMGVDVDQARHDHAALGVHKLGVGVLLLHGLKGAGFLYRIPIQHHGPILQVGEGLAPGDQSAIANQ